MHFTNLSNLFSVLCKLQERAKEINYILPAKINENFELRRKKVNDWTNNPETFYVTIPSSEYRTNWIWNIPCFLFISTREINTAEDYAILNDNTQGRFYDKLFSARFALSNSFIILNADKIITYVYLSISRNCMIIKKDKYYIDNCHHRINLTHDAKRTKSITTSRKSILKLCLRNMYI